MQKRMVAGANNLPSLTTFDLPLGYWRRVGCELLAHGALHDRGTIGRPTNAGMFERFLGGARYSFGREPGGAPSHTWTWQEPASQNRGSRKRQPDV